MPKFRICLSPDSSSTQAGEGEIQSWNLPWERLVFDQRIDYQPQGVAAVKIYRIAGIREDDGGTVYDAVLDPGLLDGGDPKKDRPPYGIGRSDS